MTQPMGRKPSRFPGKTDNHPKKPLVNWWENEGPDANKTRAKVEAKKEIETEINDSE